MNVYDILYPPLTQYKGWVQIATLNKDKQMISLGYSDFQHIKEKAENLKINPKQDYYIMANTVKQYTKRTSDNLFSLNNIVIDCDIHSDISSYERDEIIKDFIWRLNRDLFKLDELPKCNVIHHTGRGIQFWWHIDSASSKLIFIYEKVIDYIVIIFKSFLDEYPELKQHIEIDVLASKNTVGLFRMFNTRNTKIDKDTYVEILHDKSFDLNELLNQLKENEIVKEHIQQKDVLKKRYTKKEKRASKTHKKNSYSALHYKRIRIIEEFAKNEDTMGKRDMMLFLAFNSARQIYPIEQAKEICRTINNSFNEPLNDLDYIFKQKKTYKIKNDTFYEYLGVSKDDLIKRGAYELSKPNITRDTERQQRKMEKQKNKDLAIKLLKSGLTHKEITKQTGLSLSTIARLSKANKS